MDSPTLAFLKSIDSFHKTQQIQAPRQLAIGLVPKDLIRLTPAGPGPSGAASPSLSFKTVTTRILSTCTS